jgi:hypothetical protein
VVEKELRRRRGLKALESIRKVREQAEAETGIHPSSVPFIRALREGTERHEGPPATPPRAAG